MSTSIEPSLWELPGQSRKVYFFNELVSTMDTAFEMANRNCTHGTVIVAGRQTGGRGRLTRVWHSEAGGLYFTVILRPDLPLEYSSRFGFVASYCLAQTLRRDFSLRAMVKWPNDLLVNDHKIAGMLSQVGADGDQIGFLNIGIGLNVNHTPIELAPQATSLSALLNRNVSRKEILSSFLKRLDKYLSDSGAMERIIENWKRYTVTLGREVKIVTNKRVYNGIARDVDASGALIIECKNGTLQTILYGDCFHR